MASTMSNKNIRHIQSTKSLISTDNQRNQPTNFKDKDKLINILFPKPATLTEQSSRPTQSRFQSYRNDKNTRSSSRLTTTGNNNQNSPLWNVEVLLKRILEKKSPNENLDTNENEKEIEETIKQKFTQILEIFNEDQRSFSCDHFNFKQGNTQQKVLMIKKMMNQLFSNYKRKKDLNLSQLSTSRLSRLLLQSRDLGLSVIRKSHCMLSPQQLRISDSRTLLQNQETDYKQTSQYLELNSLLKKCYSPAAGQTNFQDTRFSQEFLLPKLSEEIDQQNSQCGQIFSSNENQLQSFQSLNFQRNQETQYYQQDCEEEVLTENEFNQKQFEIKNKCQILKHQEEKQFDEQSESFHQKTEDEHCLGQLSEHSLQQLITSKSDKQSEKNECKQTDDMKEEENYQQQSNSSAVVNYEHGKEQSSRSSFEEEQQQFHEQYKSQQQQEQELTQYSKLDSQTEYLSRLNYLQKSEGIYKKNQEELKIRSDNQLDSLSSQYQYGNYRSNYQIENFSSEESTVKIETQTGQNGSFFEKWLQQQKTKESQSESLKSDGCVSIKSYQSPNSNSLIENGLLIIVRRFNVLKKMIQLKSFLQIKETKFGQKIRKFRFEGAKKLSNTMKSLVKIQFAQCFKKLTQYSHVPLIKDQSYHSFAQDTSDGFSKPKENEDTLFQQYLFQQTFNPNQLNQATKLSNLLENNQQTISSQNQIQEFPQNDKIGQKPKPRNSQQQRQSTNKSRDNQSVKSQQSDRSRYLSAYSQQNKTQVKEMLQQISTPASQKKLKQKELNSRIQNNLAFNDYQLQSKQKPKKAMNLESPGQKLQLHSDFQDLSPIAEPKELEYGFNDISKNYSLANMEPPSKQEYLQINNFIQSKRNKEINFIKYPKQEMDYPQQVEELKRIKSVQVMSDNQNFMNKETNVSKMQEPSVINYNSQQLQNLTNHFSKQKAKIGKKFQQINKCQTVAKILSYSKENKTISRCSNDIITKPSSCKRKLN